MRWLIIPDIHDKVRRVNEIIDREPHDRLLLMGDYFDDFNTGATDAAHTAANVKKWLNAPNTACLLGNHDMSYGWGNQNRRFRCPGYDASKWITINSIITPQDWRLFKLHTWVEARNTSWLATHAGFHLAWLAGFKPDHYRARIDSLCGVAWAALLRGEHHFLLGRGASRCGDQEFGGLNWMDWIEFLPIPGINQLMGHSAAETVRYAQQPGSKNICLDTHLRHYAVFEDGKLQIKPFDNLKFRDQRLHGGLTE